MDSASNNLQRLICYKTQQTRPFAYADIPFSRWDVAAEVCELVQKFLFKANVLCFTSILLTLGCAVGIVFGLMYLYEALIKRAV